MATPSRAEMTWRIKAMKLARATTQSSPYLNCAPPARSVPQLPGIHVADADENRRAGESQPLPPEAGLVVRHRHGAVHLSSEG